MGFAMTIARFEKPHMIGYESAGYVKGFASEKCGTADFHQH